MPDREKVIKGLEALQKSKLEHQCYACSYEFIETVKEFGTNIIADALALLKEKEPVRPRVSSVDMRCGNCNKVIEMDGWIACPWCGTPIDWEGWWSANEAYRRR